MYVRPKLTFVSFFSVFYCTFALDLPLNYTWSSCVDEKWKCTLWYFTLQRPKVNDKFDSVWSNYLASAQHNMENYDFASECEKVQTPENTTDNVIQSNKCNQYGYDSLYANQLRTHMKMHIGEKSNKCNQCDYASSQASNLRQHLKTHTGVKQMQKSNKCNQCDYASSLKMHSGEKMQPMWLCLFAGRRFEGTFKNAQWRKLK